MAYFDNLEQCISRHGLRDKPHLIYNIDEKGISVEHKPPYIVASADYCAQAVTSGKGKTVTIIGAGSASGMAIPPYFIFPGKRMNADLLKGASPGACGTVSETGWSNTEVFRQYLTEHFLKFVPERTNNKVLLLLDGHRSHIALDIADWAKSNNIVLFILPAHTSHLLQPLDVACYGPFQRMYYAQCHKVIRQTSAAITKYNLCEIASKVYSKALCSENLQAAFKKTGIYPADRNAIPKQAMLPAEVFSYSEPDSDDTESTVEGGIFVGNEISDIFEKAEQKLKAVKNEKTNKPRRTVSKLVSGKELTSDSVIRSIEQHENEQKKATKKPKKPVKEIPLMVKSSLLSSPKPGPSHINLALDSSASSTDGSDSEEEKCCHCGLFQPKELSNCVSLTFVKWAQCDGLHCKHWTHLIYCTPTRVIRRGDKFLCPHCKDVEE
jgi:hypothetical protein